jgi:hypothetical protein
MQCAQVPVASGLTTVPRHSHSVVAASNTITNLRTSSTLQILRIDSDEYLKHSGNVV